MHQQNPETQTPEPQEIDQVESVLLAYGGDFRTAIRDLIADADFLRDELVTAATVMSKGMARGWRPRYERP